jgi:hypothetical protein
VSTWPPDIPEEGSVDETNALAAYAPWNFFTLDALRSIVDHLTTGEPSPDYPVALYDPFSTGVRSPGTGGTCIIRGQRLGARFRGGLYINAATDHNYGAAVVLVLDPSTFPFVPRVPPASSAEPGGFGYLVHAATNPPTNNNGFRYIIASGVSNLGLGAPSVLFIPASDRTGFDGGLGNLWGGTNPTNLTGLAFTYQVIIDFELA